MRFLSSIIFSLSLLFSVADKVLVYQPTIASSNEVDASVALGYTVDVVDSTTWASMTASDFNEYRAIIFGDPFCSGDRNVVEGVPTFNNAVWSSVVDGNIMVVGTDEVFHSSQGGFDVTSNGIKFVTNIVGKTGLYVSLSCYYHGTVPFTPVPLLSQFGSFTTTGVGCHNNAHIVASHPALTGLTDASLSNWGCSVHEAFDSFPPEFIPLAIARGVTGSGSFTFVDGSFGIPYILARGETLSPLGCGNGAVDLAEECDDGNTDNGDGCSARCTIEFLCGNSVLDIEEECDDGNVVGGDGCSAECQFENEDPNCTGMVLSGVNWPPNHAFSTMVVSGLSDPDGDALNVTVASVYQNEPTNATGGGTTCVDAIFTPLQLRRERLGTGTGRVYKVTLLVTDGRGGSCVGSAYWCVPHNKNRECVYNNTSYDSTACD